MAINNTVDDINNQPTIQPQNISGIFTKYIAKTLPLAFDESMSYYECLCALLEYLNDTVVANINNTNAGLGELQEFYEDLQTYVNNYFDNLDVQEEINIKLDKMVESGVLSSIIAHYIQPRIDAQNEVISQISDKVNAVIDYRPLVADDISSMTDTTKTYILANSNNWYYYNGTSWVVGGVYQGVVIPDNSITPIKIKGHSILNLLNLEDPDILENTVMRQVTANSIAYDATTGTLNVSGWIPVEPGQIIYSTCVMSNAPQSIVYFDSSKNVIGMYKITTNWTALGEITIPENCYYIRIGYNYASTKINAVYTCDEDNVPSSYIPYGKFTIDGLYVEETSDIIEINIKKDGTGDYTTIRDALESTNTTNTYIINVYPGTYNVMDDYTSTEIQNASYIPTNIRGSFCGPYVDGNITLRGIGDKNDIIIKGSLPNTYSSDVRSHISTLNLQGNVTLENLTIIGANIRYPIHDDFISQNKTTNIINCIIKSETLDGRISDDMHSYGMGTKSGKITNLKDCILIPRFYMHTNKNFTLPSITNLENCYVYENIYVHDMNSGKKDIVNIKNCVTDMIRFNYYPGNTSGTVEVYCNTKIPCIHQVTNYYITDDIKQFRNTTENTITKGSLIQKNNTTFEILYTGNNYSVINDDNTTLFHGICLDDVLPNNYGRVQTTGLVRCADIGLTANIGDKFTISNGELITTNDDNYIAICNMDGYIELI